MISVPTYVGGSLGLGPGAGLQSYSSGAQFFYLALAGFTWLACLR